MIKGIPAAVRQRVYERDRICRGCGIATGLQIHHVTYRSQGGKHDEHNLVLLCLRCHDRAHAEHVRWQPLLREVLQAHYERGLWLSVLQVARRLESESPRR